MSAFREGERKGRTEEGRREGKNRKWGRKEGGKEGGNGVERDNWSGRKQIYGLFLRTPSSSFILFYLTTKTFSLRFLIY